MTNLVSVFCCLEGQGDRWTGGGVCSCTGVGSCCSLLNLRVLAIASGVGICPNRHIQPTQHICARPLLETAMRKHHAAAWLLAAGTQHAAVGAHRPGGLPRAGGRQQQQQSGGGCGGAHRGCSCLPNASLLRGEPSSGVIGSCGFK